MNEIFTRTSTREFTEEKISEDKIELLCRAAMQAPSGRNSQPWELIVVDDKDIMLKVADIAPAYRACRTSSHLIIVMGNNDSNLWTHDMGASCENILLEAEGLGLGAVWQAIEPNPARIEPIRELFGIPEHVKPFAVIALGYPVTKKEAVSRYMPERVHRNHF